MTDILKMYIAAGKVAANFHVLERITVTSFILQGEGFQVQDIIFLPTGKEKNNNRNLQIFLNLKGAR